MANGFLTESPASRHGSSDVGVAQGWVLGQKFNCPEDCEISEIGVWAKDNRNEMRLAIFTDDSGNGCPEIMVANSESATLQTASQIAKVNHIYETKPELTGGVDYWIVAFLDAPINLDYEGSSGEDGVYVTGYTAYTWPTGDNWHSSSSGHVYDLSFYAVYAAVGGGLSIPVAMYHYRSQQ